MSMPPRSPEAVSDVGKAGAVVSPPDVAVADAYAPLKPVTDTLLTLTVYSTPSMTGAKTTVLSDVVSDCLLALLVWPHSTS